MAVAKISKVDEWITVNKDQAQTQTTKKSPSSSTSDTSEAVKTTKAKTTKTTKATKTTAVKTTKEKVTLSPDNIEEIRHDVEDALDAIELKGGNSIQDNFLNILRGRRAICLIKFFDGSYILGRIHGFDQFTVVLKNSHGHHLIYKQNIRSLKQFQEVDIQKKPATKTPVRNVVRK